jgi:hypothetical protein
MSQNLSPWNLFFTRNILLAIFWAWSKIFLLIWHLCGYSKHRNVKILWHVGVCVQLPAVPFILQKYRIFFNAATRKKSLKIFTPEYNFFLSVILYFFFVYFLFFLRLSLFVYVFLCPWVIWFSASCCLCLGSFFIVGSFYPPLGNTSFSFLTEYLYSVFFCVSSISSFCLQDDKEYTRVEKYELFTFIWSYFRITFATLHASFTSFYYISPWRSHRDEQFNCISLSCCYAFFSTWK